MVITSDGFRCSYKLTIIVFISWSYPWRMYVAGLIETNIALVFISVMISSLSYLRFVELAGSFFFSPFTILHKIGDLVT